MRVTQEASCGDLEALFAPYFQLIAAIMDSGFKLEEIFQDFKYSSFDNSLEKTKEQINENLLNVFALKHLMTVHKYFKYCISNTLQMKFTGGRRSDMQSYLQNILEF